MLLVQQLTAIFKNFVKKFWHPYAFLEKQNCEFASSGILIYFWTVEFWEKTLFKIPEDKNFKRFFQYQNKVLEQNLKSLNKRHKGVQTLLK